MNRLLRLWLLLLPCAAIAGTPSLSSFCLSSGPVFADTIPPDITCPQNITLTPAPNDCSAPFSYSILVSDDQPNPVLSQLEGLPSGSMFPIGTTGNAFQAEDGGGNISGCWFSVTVLPPAPMLICNDFFQISLGAGCTATLTPFQVLDFPSSDCLDTFFVELDKTLPYGNGPWLPPVLTAADLGKPYQFRVSDPLSGNKCWGTVKAVDGQQPALECQDLIIPCALEGVTPTFLRDSLGIPFAIPVATDDCGAVKSLTFQDAAVLENCVSGFTQTIQRTWTAVDNSGNSASCIQSVHLKPLQLQEITLPPNVSMDCHNPDLSTANTGAPEFKFFGISYPLTCNIGYTFADTLVSICPGHDRVLREWFLVDWCTGNVIDSIQRIDLEGQSGLAIACEPVVTVVVSQTNCTGATDLPAIGLVEDCSPVASVQALWEKNGVSGAATGLLLNGGAVGVFNVINDFPVGTIPLTYVATDSCGNTASCVTTLEVLDNEPPVAVCDTLLNINLDANGIAKVAAPILDNGSFDACNTLDFKARRLEVSSCEPNDMFSDTILFCCADRGDTIDIILRVYDINAVVGPVSTGYAASQSADCITRIAVKDNQGPKCTLMPNVTVNCENFDPTLAAYGDLLSQTCAVDSVSRTANYSLFDTICHRGTITRTFRVFDTAGNSGQCTQRVVATYSQDYYVRFPDDVILTACNGNDNFGEPEIFGEDCELMGISFEDETFTVVPDACIKIERTWTIINWCTYNPNTTLINVPNPNPSPTANHQSNLPGPVVSAPGALQPWSATVKKINPADADVTDFATFWSANANGYRYKQVIKIIDTQKPQIDLCPALSGIADTTGNDSLLWNEPYWSYAGNSDMPEGPADLHITATDLCAGANLQFSYLLFLDLDNDGTRETVVNSDNPPAPGTVNFDNANMPNYSGGTVRDFDARAVSADELYRFALHETVDGDNSTASVRWKTAATPGNPGIAPQLPPGSHAIRWTVTDACGNQSTCNREFIIDGTAPEISCDSAITVEIQANYIATLPIAEVLLDYTDDTPSGLLSLSLRKSGAGSGFPVDSSGAQVGELIYGCSETGASTAELWVSDLAGNTGFCEIAVTVTDIDSSCQNTNLTIAGQFMPPVTGVTVVLNAAHPQSPPINMTGLVDGAFSLPGVLPFKGDYTLTPYKNDNPLNGVSTFDLVLISKHILDILPLDSPYKYIAADANKSNSITTFDIVELRKLILGIYADFPNNTSWRFVDKDFVFTDPLDPFQSAFPESIARTNVVHDQLEDDFVAVKVGDVNDTAIPDDLAPADISVRADQTLFFDLQNRPVLAGETFTTGFFCSEPVSGYQFTLNYDGLEVVDILPGQGLSVANFGVFPNAVTCSVENGSGGFTLVFRSKKAGRLSEMIAISSRITRAEAYRIAGNTSEAAVTKLDIALRFDQSELFNKPFELYQNRPNPFDGSTLVSFYLPEATTATFSVFDLTGRMLYSKTGNYPSGDNTVLLDRNMIGNATGVLYYQLQSPKESAVGRMVRQ